MIAYRSKWVCGYFSVALAILIISMPGSAARAQQSLASTPSPAVSGVTAGTTLAEAPNNQPARVDDKNRSYTKEELIATIPADDQHKSPLRLTALLPLLDSNFLVTRHQGESRPDRLALWKKAGDNSYQLLDVMYCDAAPEQKFQSPIVIDVDKQTPPPNVQLLYIVKSGRRKPIEIPFVIDSERMELTPATIESSKPDRYTADALPQSHQPAVWGQFHVREGTFIHGQWLGHFQLAGADAIEVGTVKIRSRTYRLIRRDEHTEDGGLQTKWALAPTPSTPVSPQNPSQ
jgi:hypothetical protein